MGGVFDFFAALVAVIVEGLLKVFASQIVMKAVVAACIYAFIFSIIPLLIEALVPSSLMNSLSTYVGMLNTGATSLICSGAQPLSGNVQTSCNAVVTMTQFGQGVAYVLAWFQFGAALQCFLPALAVAFLFRRI